jgi:sugar-specific transcriptional regulator TrmB
MSGTLSSRSHPLETMLAVSDVIRNRRYAAVYARILELGTPTVEEVAAGLDSSTTTVYEDVNHLSEVGIVERVTETQPHRYRARSVEMTVQEAEETYQVSPTLLVALARTESNDDLGLYLDRNGTAGLATAVEYARDYVRGRTNARVLAREEDIPVLEAETVLQVLREIVLEVESGVEDELDLEELDAAVEESSPE